VAVPAPLDVPANGYGRRQAGPAGYATVQGIHE